MKIFLDDRNSEKRVFKVSPFEKRKIAIIEEVNEIQCTENSWTVYKEELGELGGTMRQIFNLKASRARGGTANNATKAFVQ